MSDILIKGMEMPKTCRRCMEMEIPVRCRVMEQEAVTAVMSGYNRPSDCPLVELPPHGRLVDADANREDFMDTVYSELYSDGDNYRANRIIDAYDNAPTIVEASTEELSDEKIYQLQSSERDYCERYEPTYNPEDGSM